MHDSLSQTPCVIGVISTGIDKDVAATWAELEAWSGTHRANFEFYPKTIAWTGSSEEFIKAVDDFIMGAMFTISELIVSTQNLDEELCSRVEGIAQSHGFNFQKL